MSRKSAYATLVLLTGVYFLSFVDRQIIAVLGVQIRDGLALSNFQVGLLYGPVFSFIYALAGIPMGRIADQTSRKAMIASGLFIWSVMTVISGFATSFTFLITARLFVGLSQAMLSPAVYSYLADTFSPQKRATVFSFYASGIFAGVAASFLVGGSIALQYDWRVAMIAVGLPGVVLAPVVWLSIKEPGRTGGVGPAAENIIAETLLLLKKKTVRLHLAGFAMLACNGYTLLAFAGNVFNDVFQRPDLTPQFGWFILGVGGTVILSGRLADRLAEKQPEKRFWMGILAALGGIPFYLIGLFNSSAELALIFIGTGVLISSSYNGVAAALIQYFAAPGQRALAGGLYLFVISIAGFGVGPPLTGWLTDVVFSGTYGVSYAIFSVFLVCGTLASACFLKAMKTYAGDEVE